MAYRHAAERSVDRGNERAAQPQRPRPDAGLRTVPIGIILFVLAIRPVERAMRANRSAPLLYAPFLFFFVSLGVYLGLIVRLNSWHIATQPSEVWIAATSGLLNPNALVPMLVFALI